MEDLNIKKGLKIDLTSRRLNLGIFFEGNVNNLCMENLKMKKGGKLPTQY